MRPFLQFDICCHLVVRTSQVTFAHFWSNEQRNQSEKEEGI